MSPATEVVEAEATEEVEPGGAMIVRPGEAVIERRTELTVDDLLAQRAKVVEAMERAMQEGIDYGVVPGTKKPTLFKPGSELLCSLFQLAPTFPIDRVRETWQGEHLTVSATCVLQTIGTGLVVAEGIAVCSTMESKYRWRTARPACPACGQEGTVYRSKYPPRDDPSAEKGWFCSKREGGCGEDLAYSAVERVEGKTENPDIADTYNTVAKMAAKRALVAAVLNATAASAVFTQDVADEPLAAPSSSPRRSSVPELHPPGSWAEMAEMVGEYGPALGWSDWLGQASEARFSKAIEELTQEERSTDLWRSASVALMALIERHGPGDFPPPSREIVQEAWASALDGVVLAGPPWSMHPDEAAAGTPTYDAWRIEHGADSPADEPPAESPAGPDEAAPAAAEGR